MVRFDSYRAASRGNRASRNLVKKSTLGGRATLQAVTRVKLEQASKAAMWTPTRRTNGEGRDDWEEPGAGARYRITVRTSRSTGVVSTCLLYTSDAADDLLCVDLGGRRIIKK